MMPALLWAPSAKKKKNSWKVYPKSFFSYLSDVQVFCKETPVIFIHSELNFCFQAIVTNLSLLYTRQEFLKKQLFLNHLQSDPPLNWFVLGGTLQFANITFLTSFQKVVQCSWHCSYFPLSQQQQVNYGHSNYWMRLSMIWRIMQIEKDDWYPSWPKAEVDNILRDLHSYLYIIRKMNAIIVLIIIQNIFKFLSCFDTVFQRP